MTISPNNKTTIIYFCATYLITLNMTSGLEKFDLVAFQLSLGINLAAYWA